MDDTARDSIGLRLRAIRRERRLTQAVVAGLAGITASYLSMIENGERPVDKRSTLEALARALRVAPEDLGALSFSSIDGDPELAMAMDGLTDIEEALTDVAFRETTLHPRPWVAVRADIDHLFQVLRPDADMVAQVRLIPSLIREVNAVLTAEPSARREALAALTHVYHAASLAANYLGARGLPAVAVMHMRSVAEELDSPDHVALAVYARSQTRSSGGRAKARELCIGAAEGLESRIGSSEPARQLYGMLHLNAALASAALQDAAASAAHLAEAREAADRAPDADGQTGFANLSFCPTNVTFWETAVSVELGDFGRVRAMRNGVQPERMRSRSRQGAYLVDLGRSLARERSGRADAVASIMRAEALSPVATRANVWARETVTDIVYRTRQDAVGRDLRGLASRMGVATNG